MTSYVALLRGIGPLNPNMRNEKLRDFFESLGFKNVRSVISTGNILFETNSSDSSKLETKIEKALPAKLGFNSTTIVRSQQELLKLIKKDPFKGINHSPKTNLNITFIKAKPKVKIDPQATKDKDYKIVAVYDREICTMIDLTGAKTPDLMTWLDKQLGKQITTRTYKTVDRIIDKFEED